MIHICIQQPSGYVHSLGFIDQARYFRCQLRRLGAQVTISKNRLRHDAVNLFFGAHLGFDPAQRARHACIFVNLEQLGDGGAKVSPDYMQLLETSAVTDYDAGNVAAYASAPGAVPVVPLLHAPYLAPSIPSPWRSGRSTCCSSAASTNAGAPGSNGSKPAASPSSSSTARCTPPNATASSCRPRPS